MAKLNILRRLLSEDFKKEERELVSKLSSIINPALESITQAFTNQLTFQDNFVGQTRDIEVIVDANGVPKTTTSFKKEFTPVCKSLMVLRAENLTNTALYPTGAPFIAFSDIGTQIVIKHVTGLQADNKYRLRIFATV